jgi:hypothetical protein
VVDRDCGVADLGVRWDLDSAFVGYEGHGWVSLG